MERCAIDKAGNANVLSLSSVQVESMDN